MPTLEYLQLDFGTQRSADVLAERGLSFAKYANDIWDNIDVNDDSRAQISLQNRFSKLCTFASRLIGHGSLGEQSPTITDPMQMVSRADVLNNDDDSCN